MPRLTPERQEARRDAILVAARRVFVEKGLHRATTHDVAREAGVPVGSIYTWFASKDELIWASILAANKAETDSVVRDVRASGSMRERIARALGGWYLYTIEAPGVATFLAEIWAESTRRPLIQDLVARRRERMVTVAAIILAEGVAAGDLPARTDVDTTARALVDMLDGMTLERLAGDGILDRTEVERRAMLLLNSAST
ncbi:MAG TPA: TetR family transcriptional regulator [Candidatus Limnocylindrales bacterium]|nr:TetR family transcriptional regulator [Candidatus Limnocylindrales bacterium]